MGLPRGKSGYHYQRTGERILYDKKQESYHSLYPKNKFIIIKPIKVRGNNRDGFAEWQYKGCAMIVQIKLQVTNESSLMCL